MADTATEASAIAALAETDLPEACNRARRLVADNPYDEAAAKLLTEVVEAFAEHPPEAPDREGGLPPELREAARLLSSEQDEPAEIIVRNYLKDSPQDVRAMAMMAEIAGRCDLYEDAYKILMRARQIDPRSVDVLLTLAKLINHLSFLEHSEDRGNEALKILEQALEVEPTNVKVVSLYSSILVRFRRLGESIPWYDRLLQLDPMHALAWTNYGIMLSSLGKLGESIAALRTATAIQPLSGMAWWEIANLKVSRFFQSDIERMEQVLGEEKLDTNLQAYLHFALAKAFDHAGELERGAEQLCLGNAIKRGIEPHDAKKLAEDTDASIETFTSEFLERRRAYGDLRPDPIFIIGIQRSGTTLIEQILASHSAIEGTEELFILLQIVKEMSARHPDLTWQEALEGREKDDVRAMGEGLLHLAEHYRVTKAPYFIDKNPTNWRFAGMIMTILPNAKIIDVRRNPMDCCYANWSQHYENGLGFSYSLETLGRYYADYVRLMRHFDSVAPGRIHRVIYDDLVDDFEPNVRGMIDYLGLPFEESCLRFYETERAVLTPSAQQVRKPINRSGLGRSKKYEPWLGELRDALGEALTNWRA